MPYIPIAISTITYYKLIGHCYNILKIMNRSEISNEFNFENELDITQTKKDKTEHYFSKEGIAFDDFMNIGDKTFKSDKQQSKFFNNNTSDILKKEKEQDSFVNQNQNFMDQFTELSIKPKRNMSIMENIALASNNHIAVSPKFPDIPGTAKSIINSSKHQFTLRQDLVKNKSQKQMPDFKKKEVKTLQQLREEQYLQLQNQMSFYSSSLDKIIYQSNRLEQETENLMANFNSEVYEIEVNQHSQAIKKINKKIQEQRNLQAQLTKITTQLQEEYQLIVSEVRNSKFSRPTKVTEEQRIIIDEINSIKAQFQNFERDEGSLNLSSTLLNNQASSLVHINTFRNSNRKDCQIGNMKIQDIYKENNISEDPRYLYNIKMSCLRDQWAIYSNSQLVIQVSYKKNPKIIIQIGNKMGKDLQKFSMLQDQKPVLKGQILAAKSFIFHEIEMKEEKIEELFIKYRITYYISNKEKVVTLFVPTGLLNFGQFSAITHKQFLNDAGNEQFQFNSGYKPLDKKMGNDISEAEYYMANLLIDRDNMKCFGLFISMFSQCSLLCLRQKGELICVSCKQNNWSIIRLIQFIFVL